MHALCHLMKCTDWEVVGVDSFRHKGLIDRVAEAIRHHPEWEGRWRVVTHDLRAPFSDMLRRRIGELDFVVNMASLSDVHDSIENPTPYVEGNVAIALSVLELARRQSGLRCFVQVSTDEVYGPTDGLTMWPEWSPIVPSNPYSASKAAQEAMACAWWRTYGVPVVVVNLMNNFGEMQSPAKFPAIVQRKVRRGEEVEIHADAQGRVGTRWYIHSRNSADAILFVLRNVDPRRAVRRPQRFNIVGDRQVGNLELAQMIAAFIGKPLVHRVVPGSASRPGHDLHYGLDGSRLAALGWRSPMSLEDSLRETVAWYERNPEWLEAR